MFPLIKYGTNVYIFNKKNNLKRKLYIALYSESYTTNKVADTLLATVDLDIKEPAPKLDK